MRVNGVPNKFEIFQDYYYDVNGEVISYADALRLFSQMDADTRIDFEQYYRDETGYEIITPTGYNLTPDLGDLKENGTKIIKRKEKQANGTIIYVDKTIKTYTNTKKVTDKNGTTIVIENYVPQSTLNNIATTYSIEAFAKENGMVIDPEWAIYSAEEIIQMENEGVNIPQDVIDIAHSIYEATATNVADAEDEADDTTEKEPFLDLIPKAQEKIEKCEENNEKITEGINELIPEQQKKEKNLNNQIEEQLSALDTYESNIREWNKLDEKLKNGETLTESETKRYSELSNALRDNSNKNEDFSFDKNEIAKSLNELNILTVLGEYLANETIEIGDTLADYTSKANYKTTRNEAIGQIGFLAALVAMAKGKNLANEANEIGNETAAYAKNTEQSIKDISEVLDIELQEIQLDENGEVVETEETTTEPEEEEEGEEDKEKRFKVTDESVLQLIDETKVINDETLGHVKEAKRFIKSASKDINFIKIAGKRVEKIIDEFEVEEEKRQQEIEEKEKENDEAEKEIAKLTGQSPKEVEKEINDPSQKNKENDENIDNDTQEKIDNYKEIIENNNSDIEEINEISEIARENVKKDTSKEKSYINEAVPNENEHLELIQEYAKEEIPEVTEDLNFTFSAGGILAEYGASEITIGEYFINIGTTLMSTPWTMAEGIFYVSLGTATVLKGTISTAIGIDAMAVSTEGLKLEKNAEEINTTAEATTNKALSGLTELDAKIISVTGDEAAGTPASDEQNSEGENTEDSVVEANTEASVNDVENSAETNSVPTENQEVSTPPVTEVPQIAQEGTNSVDETTEEIVPEATPEVTGSESTESSSKDDNDDEEEEETGDKNDQKDAEDIGKNAQADGKESATLKTDTEKDEKTLDKEAKKIQKEMQKDEQEIAKMTQESQEAAQKQEELLTQYEALVAESDMLISEDEQNQQGNTAVQPANNSQQQAGASSSFSIGIGGNNDNTQKLQENELQINTLSNEFQIQGRVITRNSTKIKSLEKKTQTNEKKLTQKCKTREKKLKEAQKKEDEKQERLKKELGAIGILENLFSITSAVGTLKQVIGGGMIIAGNALLSNPFTAAAGAALVSAGTVLQTDGGILVTIGGYGTAACGVTKGIINIANGNLTAGLISIGSAIVSAASCGTAASAGAESVLQQVSAGLQIVSSSADMVNNVRAVQGKESNGVFSKISTTAGVVGSLTSSAAGFTDGFQQADTLGKTLQVASAAGTAMSSTSQLMSEYGADGKAANMLGMIGGGLQTTASVAQLAQKFSGASEKNEENEQKTEETNNKSEDKNADGTEKTKEQKKAEAKQKKEEAKQAKEQKKAEEKARKEAEKTQKQQEKQQQKAELEEAKQAKNDKKAEAKGVKDKNDRKNMTENGASKEYADLDDDRLEDYRLEAIGQGNEELAGQYAAEQKSRADYKAKMGLLDANSQSKNDKIELGMKSIGAVGDVVGKVLSSSDTGEEQQDNNNGNVDQWDLNKDKRYKRIKKTRQMQQKSRNNYIRK